MFQRQQSIIMLTMKNKKISDPHRLHREARYDKEEVDRLAIERGHYPTGICPVWKIIYIYNCITITNLFV